MNYKKTLVIAPLYFPANKMPEGAKWMLESAKLHGIEVMQIGVGQRWTNHYDSKIVKVYEQTKNLTDYEYVVFIDGSDSLFTTGLGELHHKFEQIGKPFVIAGEHHCWPWWNRYCEINPLRPARFAHLNSGFMMSTWNEYLRIFQAVMDQKDDGYSERGKTIKNDDQAAFYRYWYEHQSEIAVDTGAKLCMCVAGLDGRWVHNHDVEWAKRPFCHVTKSCPCVLHFNSGEKWRMKDAWDLLQR